MVLKGPLAVLQLLLRGFKPRSELLRAPKRPRICMRIWMGRCGLRVRCRCSALSALGPAVLSSALANCGAQGAPSADPQFQYIKRIVLYPVPQVRCSPAARTGALLVGAATRA
jgi:hypothetical protein